MGVVDEVVFRVYGPAPERAPVDTRSKLSLLRSPPRAHSTEPFPLIRRHAKRLVQPRYSSSLSDLALPWRRAQLPTHPAFYDEVNVDWKAGLREGGPREPPLSVAPMVAQPPVSIPRAYPRIAPSPALTVPCSCPHGEHHGHGHARAAPRPLGGPFKAAGSHPHAIGGGAGGGGGGGGTLGLLPPDSPVKPFHIAPAQALLEARRPETGGTDAPVPPAGLQAPLRLADALLRADQRSRAGRAARGRRRPPSPPSAADGDRPGTGGTDMSGLLRIAGDLESAPPTPPLLPLAPPVAPGGSRSPPPIPGGAPAQLHASDLAASGADARYVARTLRKFLPETVSAVAPQGSALAASRLADAPPPPPPHPAGARKSARGAGSNAGAGGSSRRGGGPGHGIQSSGSLLALGLQIAESVAARAAEEARDAALLAGREGGAGEGGGDGEHMGDLLVGRVGRVNVAQRDKKGKRDKNRPKGALLLRTANDQESGLPTDIDDFFSQIADMALKDEKVVERVRDRIVNILADALMRGNQEDFLSFYDRIPVAFTQADLDNMKHRAWKIVEQKGRVWGDGGAGSGAGAGAAQPAGAAARK
eukprot:tig00000600_g2271.t1